MGDARGGVPREAADVHLVDDRLVHRLVERTVAFPVVVRDVDHHAPHRGRQVVAGAAGVDPVPDRVGIAEGVKVDEDLAGIEAEPFAVKVVGAVHAVGVVGARPQPLDVNVPEEKRLVDGRIELDDLGRLPVVVLVEEEQLHGGGISRKGGKVDAALVRDGTQRVGVAGGDFVVWAAHGCPAGSGSGNRAKGDSRIFAANWAVPKYKSSSPRKLGQSPANGYGKCLLWRLSLAARPCASLFYPFSGGCLTRPRL